MEIYFKLLLRHAMGPAQHVLELLPNHAGACFAMLIVPRTQCILPANAFLRGYLVNGSLPLRGALCPGLSPNQC